ncbi:MAG: pilus (MSHA type) biogenesis protein MshL [Magnetococcales bacterium]|nr:pilus (MSHA type) biogenesis protein MshL [Magnetococcales bacterium]
MRWNATAHFPPSGATQSAIGAGALARWMGIGLCGLGLVLTGCAQSNIQPSKQHFLNPTLPPPVAKMPAVPREQQNISLPPVDGASGAENGNEVYTITVTNHPVKDLLFTLARDANMNIDVYPGIDGLVTLNVVDQTLPQILDRIARQINLRYEISDHVITVAPDVAFLKIYQVDYVNVARTSTSSNKVSTQLSTAKPFDAKNPENTGFGDSNQSETTLTSKSENQFWASMLANVNAILNADERNGQNAVVATGGSLPALPGVGAAIPGLPPQAGVVGGGNNAAGGNSPNRIGVVSVNQEAGLITIYATARQHERIQALLDSTMGNVHRQVLIESTVVEVSLNDQFQEGVDWASISKAGNQRLTGNLVSNSLGLFSGEGVPSSIANLPFFSLPLTTGTSQGNVTATIRALSRFGDAKVLSSPKIMALNNQTSILKVVNNRVFFTVKATAGATSNSQGGTDTTALINTEVHTVPVGLVMSVTPQISSEDVVTLNVRPTISNISRWVSDPNPHLIRQTGTTTFEKLENLIPEIQVKEMESVLRVNSGQVAVMGGLMQDKFNNNNSSVPLVSQIPLLGKMFQYRDDTVTKTELVIFIRPVVIADGRPKTPTTFMATRSNSSSNGVIVGGGNSTADPGAAPAASLPPMEEYRPYQPPAMSSSAAPMGGSIVNPGPAGGALMVNPPPTGAAAAAPGGTSAILDFTSAQQNDMRQPMLITPTTAPLSAEPSIVQQPQEAAPGPGAALDGGMPTFTQ